jgi:hypothetical protein
MIGSSRSTVPVACFADPEKLVSYLRLELIGKAMPVFHHGPL